MGKKIQHKRGLKQDLPILNTAEIGFVTDEEQLYVGTNQRNIRLLDEKDLKTTNEGIGRLENEARKIGDMYSLGTEFRDITTSLSEREINAKDYGVKGDGTNETQSLQNAINALRVTGGTILLPAGRVKAKGLQLYPNIRIRGVGKSTILEAPSAGGYMFQVTGSIGSPMPLIEDRVASSSSISTLSNHGLNVNDDILVMSQRDCLSSDAGNWRLGVGTPGVRYAYFGEFKKVRSVLSDNSIGLSSPLFFPSYNKDKTRETSQYAANSAVIQKVNFIKNVIIEDMTIIGELAGIANFHFAFNCAIRNIDWLGGHEGTYVVFRESLKCHGENLNVEYTLEKEPSSLYMRNPYKIISSHLCGFKGCKAINATQAVDFTFQEGRMCTAFAYFNDGDITDATDNAATSHGGTYASQFLNNRMTNCKKGISTRSRLSIITGNILTGHRSNQSTYGVSIYDGWARDCVVANNVIIGFGSGIEVTEKEDGMFDYVGLSISVNKIQECLHGIWLRRHSTNKYTGNCMIKIYDNTISRADGFGSNFAKLIRVDPYYHGVEIFRNDLVVNSFTNAAVYLDKNTSNFNVTFNTFLSRDGGNSVKSVWVESPNDTALFPGGRVQGFYYANQIEGTRVPDTEFVAFTLNSRDFFGNFVPAVDGAYTIGFSTRRWNTIYASTGTINTSDRNMKQQITEIPDEVLDAWADIDYVKFKFNDAVEEKGSDKARWHIGLISQEIEETFAKHGLDATEFGLIGIDKFEDEWDGETLVRPAGEIYSIRPDECQFLELALMRRELNKLKNNK